MNNRSYIFWVATLFGVLVGIYLYSRYIAVKKEQFTSIQDTIDSTIDSTIGGLTTMVTDIGTIATSSSTSSSQQTQLNTTSASSTASATASVPECPAGVYAEDTSKIPYDSLMRLYLSSFSDRTADGSRNPYCMNLLRWFDFKNPSIYFNVNSTTPPASILGKGLRTKNVTLIGPPSEYVATDTGSYELKPFTIFFYASLAQPVFNNSDEEITVFRLYAETPNSVRLIFKQSLQTNRTKVQLILGTNQNRYTWNITTSTLISNGNPCLYALTFDTDLNSADKVATLHIGKSQYIANIIDFTKNIKLSNSRMEINSSGSFDANIYSFGFIDHKLTSTEVSTLGDYMYNQHTGTSREMIVKTQEIQQTYDTKLETTVTDLTSQLDKKEAEKVAECVKVEDKEEVVKNKKWNIFMPTPDTAVATDAELCSGLKIPNPSPSKAPVPVSSESDRFHINYPQEMTNVTEVPVDMSPTTPSVTPTVLQNTSAEAKTYTPIPSTTPVQPSVQSTQSRQSRQTILSGQSGSIEPPYYDADYYNTEPMVLDESQGWTYSD